MSQPYFDTDENAVGFYSLIGRVVTQWSAIERSVDTVFFVSKCFVETKKKEKMAIVSWSRKFEAFSKLLRTHLQLQPQLRMVNDLLAELEECVKCRHIIVHGYFMGMLDENPPRIYFRSSRYNESSIQQSELKLSAQQMTDIVKQLNQLDLKLQPIVTGIALDQCYHLSSRPY